jgi:lipopolysaccharide/colanic/teichoic acid biosynthesis glycosyltransferase
MYLKRCSDLVLSALLLALSAPLFIVAAAAVWIDSGRPLLFRQVRVGRWYRTFEILKFRTMAVGANGPGVTVGGDPRITRVGKLLRRTKIDELPQLWNVLRGEMSIVGPRPEIPQFVELFHERFRNVLTVRPGITDPASIRYRDEEAVLSKSSDPLSEYRASILPAKLDLADKYIGERSLLIDLQIIVRTIFAIFSGFGS